MASPLDPSATLVRVAPEMREKIESLFDNRNFSIRRYAFLIFVSWGAALITYLVVWTDFTDPKLSLCSAILTTIGAAFAVYYGASTYDDSDKRANLPAPVADAPPPGFAEE